VPGRYLEILLSRRLIGASLAQEFLFGEFTRRSGHMK
jgi:hypothetical protein